MAPDFGLRMRKKCPGSGVSLAGVADAPSLDFRWPPVFCVRMISLPSSSSYKRVPTPFPRLPSEDSTDHAESSRRSVQRTHSLQAEHAGSQVTLESQDQGANILSLQMLLLAPPDTSSAGFPLQNLLCLWKPFAEHSCEEVLGFTATRETLGCALLCLASGRSVVAGGDVAGARDGTSSCFPCPRAVGAWD